MTSRKITDFHGDATDGLTLQDAAAPLAINLDENFRVHELTCSPTLINVPIR